MALKATLSSNLADTSKWLGAVEGGNIPITTQHSSSGTSDIVTLYIFNDGKRDSDGDENYSYEYRNVYLQPRGKRSRIITVNDQNISTTDTTISVDDPRYYTAGTKLLTDPIYFGTTPMVEEVWVKSIQGNNLIVDRGQNNTQILTIPDRTWLEAKPDHIYLSLTGAEDSWIQGNQLPLPDLIDKSSFVKVYMRVTTGALKTQVKIDSYLSIFGNEFVKV